MQLLLSFYTHLSAPRMRAALVSLLGTTIEYYDYALYGFCASILANQFFNESDNIVGLIKVYGVFAAGSLAKPIGSLIFGTIGDKWGRQISLRWSMVGIAIPMTVITLCPTYSQWGWVAALLLIFSRIIQGIFISGESDGARIFIFETFKGKHPFLANCFVGISCYVGIFIASQASIFAHAHGDDNFWRIPFLMGGLMGLIMLFLRRRLIETDDFLKMRQHPLRIKTPINWQGILATVCLCGAVGGTYHLFFVYLPTYLGTVTKILSTTEAQGLTTLCLTFYIPALVVTALLADRFGGMRIILMGAFACIPILLSLNQLFFVENLAYVLILLSLTLALFHGPGFVLLMNQFDVSVRFRSVSIGHSVGSMLFSGTAPMLSALLWGLFESPLSIVFHLAGLMVLGIFGILMIQKPNHLFSHTKKKLETMRSSEETS